MPITEKDLEIRFQARRQELEQIEQHLGSLEQEVSKARMQYQQVLGQIQTLQELYSEIESQQGQQTEVLELDNNRQQDTD